MYIHAGLASPTRPFGTVASVCGGAGGGSLTNLEAPLCGVMPEVNRILGWSLEQESPEFAKFPNFSGFSGTWAPAQHPELCNPGPARTVDSKDVRAHHSMSQTRLVQVSRQVWCFSSTAGPGLRNTTQLSRVGSPTPPPPQKTCKLSIPGAIQSFGKLMPRPPTMMTRRRNVQNGLVREPSRQQYVVNI